MTKKVITSWKKFAQKVSEKQTSIFLVIFYLILLLPIGLIFRLFLDIFRTKKPYQSQWLERKKKNLSLKDLKLQH